jgi:hypothetical protein
MGMLSKLSKNGIFFVKDLKKFHPTRGDKHLVTSSATEEITPMKAR